MNDPRELSTEDEPRSVDPDPEALPDRERPEALDQASEPDVGAYQYEDRAREDGPPEPPAAGESGNP
jgi:hypothetical protein